MIKRSYETAGEIVLIPYDRIFSDPKRQKRYYDSEELEELVNSIAENGLIDPIVVNGTESERYKLVSGERRYRASVLAGMKEIPCIIIAGDASVCALYSLIDNQHHKKLGYFEEAEHIQRLIREHGMSIADLSEKLSKSEKYIYSKLKLLAIPEDIRKRITEDRLSEEYARIILTVPENKMPEFTDEIIENDLSVTQAEKRADELSGKQGSQKKIMIFKDIKVFTNTVERAISTMNRCGIEASDTKEETDRYIEYRVRIVKPDIRV